jgi:hypothetical protein
MVRVALGTFACKETQARPGDDLAVGVRAALEHYARRLELGPAPPEFPRFRREQRAETIGADLELSVEPGIRETLECEARRSGVPVEQLAVHAVFIYLADIDRAAGQEARPEIPAVPSLTVEPARQGPPS